MKNENLSSENILLPLCSAVCATVIFFLYAPLSIYLANAEEFPFTLCDFWFVPVLLFLATTGLLFMIGLLLKKFRTVQIIWCSLLCALGILVYLQGNFLFEDSGIFNGLPYDASEHIAQIRTDTVIWCLVLLFAAVLAFRFKEKAVPALTMLSGLFSVFILTSAAVLVITTATGSAEYLQPRTTFVSTDGLYSASAEKNVIVIVPDMFDRTYMDAILEESPELTEDLNGFVYYPDTVGCFRSTKESLPYFLSQEDLYNRLRESGYSLGIYTDGRFIPEALRDDTVNCVSGRIRITDYRKLAALLCRLSACAYAPDLFREYVWLSGTEFDELCTADTASASLYSNGNMTFYNNMKENGIQSCADPCFRLIHIYGAHYPYIHDEYLNPITPSFTDENAIGAAKGTLRIIIAYLNRLKAAGSYDSSLIVIMADHGYTVPDKQTDPVFMMKLPCSDKAFSVSDETVRQENFPEMIRSAIP